MKLFKPVNQLAPGLQFNFINNKAPFLKERAMEKIQGIVVPTDWDSNGNVISLAIATGGEQEYLIENHRQVTNLWALIRQEVVATGSIKCLKEHKIIKVAKISAVEMNDSC